MGKVSGIDYVDASWNPWMGCTKTSEGCAQCYAEREMKRFGRDFNTITKSKTTFDDPLKWKKPLRILVGSWMDFFHPDVLSEWRKDAWEIMRKTPQHTYLLLTKRPENFQSFLPVGWEFDDLWKTEFSRVWLGVSAENQARANERIPLLMRVSAKVRFISAEPLLGPIDFTEAMYGEETHGMNWFGFTDGFGEEVFIQWIITGGESGPNHRPCDLDWVRSIRDQCVDAGVAFFHKQWGGTKKIGGAWGGRELDGHTWNEIPPGDS